IKRFSEATHKIKSVTRSHSRKSLDLSLKVGKGSRKGAASRSQVNSKTHPTLVAGRSREERARTSRERMRGILELSSGLRNAARWIEHIPLNSISRFHCVKVMQSTLAQGGAGGFTSMLIDECRDPSELKTPFR